LKRLPLAPKSKSHLKNLMRVLFNAALRWELIPYQLNPMSLVRVKDASKRKREPKALSADEFRRMLEYIPEPFRLALDRPGPRTSRSTDDGQRVRIGWGGTVLLTARSIFKFMAITDAGAPLTPGDFGTHSTLMATGSEGIPFVTTTRLLGPVS